METGYVADKLRMMMMMKLDTNKKQPNKQQTNKQARQITTTKRYLYFFARGGGRSGRPERGNKPDRVRGGRVPGSPIAGVPGYQSPRGASA